jgi:hypothetical protein
VSGEVAARQLGQGGLALGPFERRIRDDAQPVAREREGVGAILAHRAEDGDPAQPREPQQVRRRLALGADPPRRQALGQLGARERALLGQRALDDLHGALGLPRRDALLPEPPATGGEARGRREPEQPRVVVAADEVQRAASEPGDDHRALLGERCVDVGGGEPGRAGAQGQARRAQVLGLHGQESRHDLGDACRPRAVQQLRGRPGAAERMRVACHHSRGR